MPRIRYIKPDFFKDEDLAQLSPLFRIAFVGLWCFADREGRLKDRPHQLKVEILPYDEVDFEEILKTLADKKPVNNNSSFITRYSVRLEKYIQINKFKEHQRPHHTERISDIPPLITDKQPLRKQKATVTKRMEMEKGMEKGMDIGSFDIFWKTYLRKEDKQYAKTCFDRRLKEGILPDQIMEHLLNYNQKIEIEKTELKYIKLPSTFLNKTDFKEKPEPIKIQKEVKLADKYPNL